ncbi:REST corepressor isoform X3 [Anopheles coustani]|uniref:REST corepressor isoform X3 n=1 Tax=Anopheles coustani TaxID=139045 RepID=UPI002658A579|nr:REST corepressor isoform X3 [Anopheles coustani]
MVLAERTTESGVRNGRRSRGPSPNGHPGTGAATAVAAGGSGTTDSSSDEENSRKNGNTSKTTKTKSEYEEKIRVGRDYQAVCPELIPQPYRKLELLNDRALLVWSPTKEIPDNKLEEYITVAKDKYGYNGEQALGMLFWHKHDLERAVLDLANFTPFPDEWTAEDRVLFEQAFQFHGKSFHRIRQMLPDKSIASLVKFYYSWKKTRSRTSVMDRQEKMKKNDSSENGSDHGSNEESDNEDKIQYNKQTVSGLKRKIDDALEVLKPPEGNTARLNSRWNNEELLLAVQGVRIYGRDFQAIADTLGSKTETQVRAFFMNYRRRFNLDAVLKEFEMASSNSSAKDQSIGSKNNGATVKKDASENPSAEGGGGASVEVADQSLASGSSETDKPKASTPSGEVVEIMDVK